MVLDAAVSTPARIWNDGGNFVNSGATITSFGGLISNSAFVESCPHVLGCGAANRDATFANSNGGQIQLLAQVCHPPVLDPMKSTT